MVGDIVRVKSVGRIAGRQHDVVGDVDKGIDGAHAHLPDAVLHLIGRGFDRDAFHLHADVAGASVAVLDLHFEVGLHVCREGLKLFQGEVVEGRDLTGDAVVSPEVGAVCHGLVVDLKENVLEVQSVRQSGACGHFKGRQVKDLRLLGGREKITQSDLIRRADHTEGSYSAKLAVLDLHGLAFTVPAHQGSGAGDCHAHSLFEVDAAAHDVLDLVDADIDLADAELVSVGMRQDFVDHTDDHVAEAVLHEFHILDLNGVHRKVISQFL